MIKWKEVYKDCFTDGYPTKEIIPIVEIQKMPVETVDDLLNVIDFLEFVKEHNVAVYCNSYFSRKEAIKHSNNIWHYSKSTGISSFIQLMRMTKGL